MSKMIKIQADVPVQGGRDLPIVTEKAYRVNIIEAEGVEVRNWESAWLPKSICANAVLTECSEGGVRGWELQAEVPEWWIKKIPVKVPSWVQKGYVRAPGPVGV